MKKKISILLVFALVLSFAVFTGCGASSDSGEASPKNVVIKPSPDKYTWYVKNYVGLNLASVGYYSMGGDIRDEYGEGTVKIVPVTEDGSFIDAEKEEELRAGYGIPAGIRYTKRMFRTV